MANAFSRTGQFLTVTFDGSTDWNSVTESDVDGCFGPTGCRLQSVQFKGVASGNGIVVREGSPDSATEIIRAVDIADIGIALQLHQASVCHPCVKATDVASGDKLNLHFA